MHIAARPSPPYRDYVYGNSKPLTWMDAVTRLGTKLGAFLKLRVTVISATSSSANHDPEFPRRPAQNDSHCQFPASCRSVSCQSESVQMFDVGVGPSLIQLETTISPFTPFWKYHTPLPTFRLDVVDANGLIQGFRNVLHETPEWDVPGNQFPPETVRGIECQTMPHLLPDSPHPPRFRPPPLHHRGPVPPPPFHAPGYIPVPPGTRAVYTTPAVLMRGQPEMSHPRVAPVVHPRDPNRAPNLDQAEVMRRRVGILDPRPEISPIA